MRHGKMDVKMNILNVTLFLLLTAQLTFFIVNTT